jgi:2,3-diketo-5-methylthio-1-phosphopentane phosphatase
LTFLTGRGVIFLVDFDGTITRGDTVDSLLEKFADPRWKRVEADWLAGRIGSRECLAEQLALVTISAEEMHAFLEGIEIDPSFAEFHAAASRIGIVAIVSDGIDCSVLHLMRAGVIPPMLFFANHVERAPSGLQISFPHQAPDCVVDSGVCKCAIARALARSHEGPTVLIGDGMSDKCVVREVDLIFAKDSLARYCEQEKIPYTSFKSFADILPLIESLELIGRGACQAIS